MEENYRSSFLFTYGSLDDNTIWIQPPSNNIFRIDRQTFQVILDLNAGLSSKKVAEKYGIPQEEIHNLIEKFRKEGALTRSSQGEIRFRKKEEDISLLGVYFFCILLLAVQIEYFRNVAHTYFLRYWYEGAIVGFISLGAVFFHELGHYVVAKKFFRNRPKLGFGFLFIFPAIYVNTQEAWTLPKNKRILINIAGVLADMMVNTVAIILAVNFSHMEYYITPFLITQYTRISFVLNPLFPTDGYWLLSDFTGVVNLSKRGLENLFKLKFNWYSVYGLTSLIMTTLSLLGLIWFFFNVIQKVFFKVVSLF
ncbi:MAG TPA: hypothetical protein ENG39_02120, partial [Candidatus Omnitrophica bacterium]|nr:hypothetical protein [Candidatus Omnitrophota bacterium]